MRPGPSSSDRVSFPAPAEVGAGRRWADYVSCAMGGSSGWDDSGDMHSGLQECDCASTIDRLIQHKDMCAGPFACDADACDMQWSAVWGRGEFASSRASLDQILGDLLRGTEVPSMPPQRLREMHQLLRLRKVRGDTSCNISFALSCFWLRRWFTCGKWTTRSFKSICSY